MYFWTPKTRALEGVSLVSHIPLNILKNISYPALNIHLNSPKFRSFVSPYPKKYFEFAQNNPLSL